MLKKKFCEKIQKYKQSRSWCFTVLQVVDWLKKKKIEFAIQKNTVKLINYKSWQIKN